MSKLIQNAVSVNDKIYNSVGVHDYCNIKVRGVSGEWMIDGGLEYPGTSLTPDVPGYDKLKIEWLILSESDSLEIIKSKLLWGTWGKRLNIAKKEHGVVDKKYNKEIITLSKKPYADWSAKDKQFDYKIYKLHKKITDKYFRWIKLIDCETSYLNNILLQEKLSSLVRYVCEIILKERNDE